MRLKYYLRGLGIGIFVTTLILVIAGKLGEPMSDEDLIKEAGKRGMVLQASTEETLFPEKPTATEKKPTTQKPTTQEATTQPVTQAPTTQAPTTQAPTTQAPTTQAPTTQAPTTQPVTQAPDAGREGVLVVKPGMYSEAVSAQLEKMGIVKSAKEFNFWLYANGYSESIQVGTFKVSSGMSYEQIAKIISGR